MNEKASEAAAQAVWQQFYAGPWDQANKSLQAVARSEGRTIITAALPHLQGGMETLKEIGHLSRSVVAKDAETARLHAIIRDLHWMARRYADGRASTAAGGLNRTTRLALALGVDLAEPLFARDALGRQYDGLTDAEAAAAARDMPKGFRAEPDDEVARLRKALTDVANAGFSITYTTESKAYAVQAVANVEKIKDIARNALKVSK